MRALIIIALIAGLQSCAGSERSDRIPCVPSNLQTATELLEWVGAAQNGYCKSKQLGDLVITSTLLPAKWKAISEGFDLHEGENPYSELIHLQVKMEI